LADLLKVDHSNRIVFAPNATHAMNIALHGFRFKSRAVVITTVGEHNAVLRPLYHLRKHRQIQVEFVPVDRQGRIDPKEWRNAISKYSPQLVAFTHASNVTGSINDAALLCSIAKQAGAATLLDASQTMGLVDVLPQKWNADMVVFTGHKYLLGPTGTGGLYISPEVNLDPLWVGGTGIKSQLTEMPEEMPGRFEAGTPNDPAFAGLGHALLWQQQNPCDYEALLKKLDVLTRGLAQVGANVVEAAMPHTPVVSFTVAGYELEELGEILYKSFGIICRTGLHCAPLIHHYIGTAPYGSIRLSLSRFTTDAEIDYCLSAIKQIIQ
jgi:selenocysteine lyase/cysteine desulfurase